MSGERRPTPLESATETLLGRCREEKTLVLVLGSLREWVRWTNRYFSWLIALPHMPQIVVPVTIKADSIHATVSRIIWAGSAGVRFEGLRADAVILLNGWQGPETWRCGLKPDGIVIKEEV